MSRPSAKLFMSFGVAFLSIAFSKTYVDKKKTRPAKDPRSCCFQMFMSFPDSVAAGPACSSSSSQSDFALP
jgi:hypothetical protein